LLHDAGMYVNVCIDFIFFYLRHMCRWYRNFASKIDQAKKLKSLTEKQKCFFWNAIHYASNQTPFAMQHAHATTALTHVAEGQQDFVLQSSSVSGMQDFAFGFALLHFNSDRLLYNALFMHYAQWVERLVNKSLYWHLSYTTITFLGRLGKMEVFLLGKSKMQNLINQWNQQLLFLSYITS